MSNVFRLTKDAFTWTVVVATIVWSVGLAALVPATAHSQEECPELQAGDLFKVPDNSAVYLLNADMRRMYFPTGEVYRTWFADFSGVVVIPNTCVDAYPAPASGPAGVNFRPGSRLVKVQISPSVYAVEPGNTKSKIASEDVARALYGDNWATLVRDTSDVFWPNFDNNGAEVTDEVPHDGQLITSESGSGVFYVLNGMRHAIDGTLPSFVSADVRTVADDVFNELDDSGETVTPSEVLADPTQLGDMPSDDGSGDEPGVMGGEVSFSLAASTPASALVPQDSTQVPYLTFQVRTGNDPVNLEEIVFHRFGLGDSNNFDKVWLADMNGTPVSNEQSVNSDETVSIVLDMVLGANTVTEMMLVANLNTADTDEQDGFRIASASMVEASGADVMGSFPVSGNLMSYSSFDNGIATIDEEGADTDIDVGVEMEIVGEFEVDYTSNNESDGMFKWIRLELDGDLDMSDLANLDLYDGGDSVTDRVEVFGDYVTFFIAADHQVIEDGENVNYEIRADIVDGDDGETITFNLEDTRDFYVVDGTSGFGAAVTNNVNAGAVTGNLQTYTVDAGQFSLSLDPSSPSNDNFAKGSQDLLGLVANANVGQPVIVDGLDVFLHTDSTIAACATSTTDEDACIDADIERVELYLNDKKIGSLSSVSAEGTPTQDGDIAAGEYKYEFNNTFTLNDDDLIKVMVDLDDDAVGDNAYKFKITNTSRAASDFEDAEYKNTGEDVPTGQFSGTATGNLLTVTDASLTITRNDGFPDDEEFVAGATDVLFFQFLIDSGIASGVRIRDLVFTASPSAAYFDANGDFFTNFHLRENGSSEALGGQFEDLESDETITFDNLNFSIDENDQVQLGLYGTINTGAATGKIDFTLDFGQSRFDDEEGDEILEVGNQDETSALLEIVDGATLTASLDGDTADAQLLATGSSSGDKNMVDVATYKFVAEDDAVYVKDFYFANNHTTTTGGNTPETDADARINKYQLVIDGEVVNEKAPVAGKVHFELSGDDRLFVPKDGTSRVTVRAVLNPITQATQTGKKLALALYAAEAESAASGADLGAIGGGLAVTDSVAALDSAPTGRTMVAFQTRPTLTGFAPDTLVLTNGVMELYEFSVTADSKGDLAWGAVIFNLSGVCDGAASDEVTECISNVSLYELEGSSRDEIDITTSFVSTTSVSSTASELKVQINTSTDSVEEVTAGTSKRYVLEATLANFEDGDSLSIGIRDQRDTHATPADFNTALGNAGFIGPFVWSDNAGVDTSLTEAHWVTGHEVEGLNTKTISLVKPS